MPKDAIARLTATPGRPATTATAGRQQNPGELRNIHF